MILKIKIIISKYFISPPKNVYFLYINKYINQYRYDPTKYHDSFISTTPKATAEVLKKAPEIIYIFWTGTNPMSENRLNGIESLKKTAEIEVQLVTVDNVKDYILPDYPLHPAYEYLSNVHKSDYLRCYFMLHYGGGYSDIKRTHNSWKKSFHSLNESPASWCLGYSEVAFWCVPKMKGKLGNDLQKYFYLLVGNGAYLFKPQSPIAKEWMKELNKRMDELAEKLAQNPGDIFGKNEGYPVGWSFILGQILHPVMLKYHEKIIKDDTIKPDMLNYR
jgi:hypothetical protein